MPSLYAHNKFGKLVIANLPKNIKNVVRKYPNSYRLGLQGPDFLFFYKAFYINKVNQYGVKLHKSDTYDFMENAIEVIQKYGYDSPQFSYILGFICHFTLDNACHPYVNESMNDTGCGHIEIEGDFENLLLTEAGFKPAEFPLHKLVPTDHLTAMSAACFYEDISTHKANACMRWMRLIKHLFVAPGKGKQKFVDLVMKASFHYKSFKGHMIEPDINDACRANTLHMKELLYNAVPGAVDLMSNFYKAVKHPEILSETFHCDFNGNKFI